MEPLIFDLIAVWKFDGTISVFITCTIKRAPKVAMRWQVESERTSGRTIPYQRQSVAFAQQKIDATHIAGENKTEKL